MLLKDDINKKIEMYKKACYVWYIGFAVALLVNIMFAFEDPFIMVIGFFIFTLGMLIYNRMVLNYYLLLKEIS